MRWSCDEIMAWFWWSDFARQKLWNMAPVLQASSSRCDCLFCTHMIRVLYMWHTHQLTEERKHSFRPFPHLIFLLPEMISQSQFVPKNYSNTSGASAAFRVNTAKMCVWRSRVTANSRWSRKQNNLISATIYLRLTALLPWCFWAVGNISWRTLLNWDSTSGRLNVKDDVILEVRVHFRNSQERYTSNKDNEIEKKKKKKEKK